MISKVLSIIHFKRYNADQEKPISESIGYPYNILPKGYPDKISDEKITETIDKFLNNLKANAGVDAIVQRETTFINLGLTELNGRFTKRLSLASFWIAVFSLIVACVSLIIK